MGSDMWRFTIRSTTPSSVAENRQRLMVALDGSQNVVDLGKESHIGHLIGFVEHDHGHVSDRDLLAVDQVDEPTRGGDDDVDALAEVGDLGAHGDAAVDLGDEQPRRLGEGSQFVAHLHTQLAGGNENHGVGAARGSLFACA